jgi:hypothetical protein
MRKKTSTRGTQKALHLEKNTVRRLDDDSLDQIGGGTRETSLPYASNRPTCRAYSR